MNLKNSLLLISILLGGGLSSFAQDNYPYQSYFEAAYAQNPLIPKGVLEAVAYTNTRITHLDGHQAPSCLGIPKQYTVMGLTLEGEGYFDENLLLVCQYGEHAVQDVIDNPGSSIMAYATTLQMLMEWNQDNFTYWQNVENGLNYISEIPQDTNLVNNYARSSFTYAVLDFLRDEEHQANYNFPSHNIDLEAIYGADNLMILSAKKVEITETEVNDTKGNLYVQNSSKSFDYGPALWVATPTCNYSSRNGTPISAVTVHTVQGSYAGAISWAQNCSANVSYHYVVRSTDGQITQMVYEADKGWHVGSENPYTIGIEHEGYVDNPAWYTISMYNSSADLVRDITQSGYGINPLRTFQGPATVGLNTIGGCTTIKGHQHYPNQSHTDPGVNWNWEYYYQLINDNPTYTNLTASGGTFFDSGGGAGNYSDDERELYLIQPTNVLSITINFIQFSLEQDWDYIYVYDGTTPQDPLIGEYTGTSVPASLTSTGDAILIEFRSDCATTDAGWEISWTSIPGPVPGDIVAPTALVDIPGNWQTTDFTATFTDEDNVGGSGVQRQLYQVIDFDGTDWRANANNGFFSDNFELAIHPDWTQQVGTWGINSSVVEQTNEAEGNSNLWANLNQDNYDTWLYHFGMNISGVGGNKRGGFHFMCDDPTLTNRGNSYFIWLREDDDKIQIYKTIADVFTLEVDVPFTINAGQWYDIKTLYDKPTGLIQLYIDNVMEASWVDTAAYVTGNSISLRSGDAINQFDNLKVYHNRGVSELVTINTGNDVQYQNTDPLTPSCKVKSIAIDSSANVSGIGDQLVNVDWTPPTSIPSINDGQGADIDNITTNTEISANWAASTDPHSDIARYWYSIGTSPLATDVVGWTDNWYADTITHTGLALIEGNTYYVCVYAENGAGLLSDTICTNGQTLQAPTATPTASFTVPNSYICSFETVQVFNSSTDAQTYDWDAPGATPSTSTDPNPAFTYSISGFYDITLTATGVGGTDTEIQTIFVNLDTVPEAIFTPSDLIVDISNPFVTFTNTSLYSNGYTWDFGDGNVSNDVNPWHQYLAVGIYDVELIAINGLCPNDTAVTQIQVVDNLSISEDEIQGIKVFPNPVVNEINIQINESWKGEVTIRLFDNRSRLVYEETIQDQNELKIDLEDKKVEEAVYFLQFFDAEKAVSRKIVVKPG